MFAQWLSSASAAGLGAFCGALGAYFLACRKEDARRKNDYLCLLLVIHEHLESLYTILADVPADSIKEIDGVKVVAFDMPLPDLDISSAQMQTLFELAPDKQMPSALIKVQHFLKAHSRRVAASGANVLPLEFVRQQARQLQFMLLSVRVQYEQATKAEFPLDELAHTSPQK